jgi:hypothetical protein
VQSTRSLARLGNQVQNDLRIRGGAKDRAIGFEFGSHPVRVHQIAIMGNGERAPGIVHRQRLGIAQRRGSGGGIAIVPNRQMSLQTGQAFSGKKIVHAAHADFGMKPPGIGGHNSRTLLTAMLQGIQSQIRQIRRFRMPIHANDSAFVMKLVLVHGLANPHRQNSCRFPARR